MNTVMSREAIIQTIMRRDGRFCFHPMCGEPFKTHKDITFDHWIPRSRGGTDSIDNYRLMHKKCNASKSDKMPNEDGTLPEIINHNSASRRAARGLRPEVCTKCSSGRMLGPFESCLVCGSGPMPDRFPRWAKAPVSECDHSQFWCSWCSIGDIERKPVMNDLLGM